MMGKPIYGNGFTGCISYLATGERGNEPERVAWSSSRNMGGIDVQENYKLAARSMRATANLSSRCKTPVMHLPISWPKEDGKVSREQMEQVADRTIKDLKLEDHQVVIYCHNDTDHQHIHLVVNRVNPETGRAWSTSRDWQRLNRSLAVQEKELGLTQCDHWGVSKERDKERLVDRSRVDDFDDLVAPTDGERRQAEVEEREPGNPFSKAKVKFLRFHLREHFMESVHWEDLEARLKARGYTLEAKGQGLIVTDGRGYAKLSQMGTSKNKVQLKELESRFGLTYRERAVELAKERERLPLKDKLEPPDLVGLSPEERFERQKEYEAAQRALELGIERPQHDDPVLELDNADWEFREWQGVEAEHRAASRDIDWKKKKVEYLDGRKDRKWDYTVKRHNMFIEYMGRVYADPEAANRRWEKLEKAHGSAIAAKMIAEDPKALGAFAEIDKRYLQREPKRFKRSIGQTIKGKIKDVSEARQRREAHQLSRAIKLMPYLAAKRNRWRHAALEVADLRQKRRKLVAQLDRAQHNLVMLENRTGTRREIQERLRGQIKRRYRALEQVTNRLIRKSDLADRRKRQLERALRLHRERKREKSRSRELGLDLGR